MGDSRIASMAAAIEPPRQGKLACVATGTSTAFWDLQAKIGGEYLWCGRFVSLQADGADCYVALTTAAASPGNDLDPATTSEADVAESECCVRIPDGQTLTLLIDGETSPWRYLAHRTASGSGLLRFWPSSKRELPR